MKRVTLMDLHELDAENAYRRGFDQALAFILQDNGAEPHQINELPYKTRVENWRYGREGMSRSRRIEAPRMTQQEAREFRKVLFVGYAEDLNASWYEKDNN